MDKISPEVTPNDPVDQQPVIGMIGMGAMGRLYVKYLSDAGWKKIHVCDLPEKYEALKHDYNDTPGVVVLLDGHAVSRSSDLIIYSVEAEYVDRVVSQYGPSTKVGAIVSGQTSVKAPERAAFDKYLPQDVHIISCHSLHGPAVLPFGQTLVLIRHRASDSALALMENVLRPLRSRYVYMTYDSHDLVMANTQAVTHAAFLSMGTAWASERSYPWDQGYYVGGIETVKVNIMLRIYSNKWHVYAGLAILNPCARVQIEQYAKSATELFMLMLAADDAALRERMYKARDKVFEWNDKNNSRAPILLSEDVLDEFSLGRAPSRDAVDLHPDASSGAVPACVRGLPPRNSHLSLLAMVDCWAHLDIAPFHHLDLAATPIFRMWIGAAEYLFHSKDRLDNAIHAALYDASHRSDDLEFVVAARGWSQCVHFGNFDLYRQRFMATAEFFETRFEGASKVGSLMIQAIMDRS